MKNLRTITYHGHIFEYEIDELKFVFIKDGTTKIGIGQMRALEKSENIDNIVSEMIELYLRIKPIK